MQEVNRFGDLGSYVWHVGVMGDAFIWGGLDYCLPFLRVVKFNSGIEEYKQYFYDLYGFHDPHTFYVWYGAQPR